MAGRLTPVLWCLLSAALFGASTPISKRLLDDLGPFTLAGLLYLGAAVAVAPFSVRGGSRERRRHPQHLRHLAGAIFFGGIVGPVLLLFGLDAARSASVSLWLELETVATAALAYLFFREHLGWKTGCAVALAVAGGVVLALPDGTSSAMAAALVAGACVCWALDNNFTSLLDGFTPAQSTLAKGLVAGAVNLGLGVAFEGLDAGALVVGAALIVGGLSYGASIVLYIAGAQALGATRSQLLFSTAPYVGVLLSWTVLGEPIATVQIVAAVLMAGGVGLLIAGEHEHSHHHHAITHSHSHRHDDGHHDHVHPGLPSFVRHTHEHAHEPITHAHAHVPDLHHRHDH